MKNADEIFKEAESFKAEFNEIVTLNAEIYKLPTMEETSYYDFGFE